MPIQYDNKTKTFHIQTPNTSYVFRMRGKHILEHLYYGKRLESLEGVETYNYGTFVSGMSVDPEFATNTGGAEAGAGATGKSREFVSSGVVLQEYSSLGCCDMRRPAFHATYENGSRITKLEYDGYEIFEGKKKLKGLPATYVEEKSEAQTLEITLCDRLTGLKAILSYTTFYELDAIAKSVRIVNGGDETINLKSVISSVTSFFDKDFDFVHLEGGWARERSIQKRPLINGIMSVDSKRVSSSHFHSPFLALSRPNATETEGEVYGFSLVYSGNHIEQVEVNPYDLVRVNVGINPFDFGWMLSPGEEFQAPEVILTYSDKGFGNMSRAFHKLYRTRLCRGKYRDCERPVLINNWEATYFDFNEEKLLNIAKKAKTVGVELMVLDDGWFGKRNDERSSLGDWVVNREKLPDGIESLAKKIEELGMKFGLWFEPEMISKDSDLFRSHPDWYIHVENREGTPSRCQFVLDLTREDVREYVYNSIASVLKSAPISYVKWDMNRNITELGSEKLPAERQSEVAHRYILGIYEVLERITTEFPDVLFEGCSGGGGRFDAGMIHYFTQYWTSDDSDAVERMYIQHGTSLVMPASTMGAHVSAVPNHQVWRTTPLKTRGNVAFAGQLGYELDLNTLTDEEIEEVKEQICTYKKIRETIHNGDMYRLRNPFEGRNCAWEYVKDDTVVLMYHTLFARCNLGRTCVRLQGLCEDSEYVNEETGLVYSGSFLMNVGLYFEDAKDFDSKLLIFKRK